MNTSRLRLASARETLRDPLLANSSLMLATTLLMAGTGSVFWIIAARLQPSSQVGLAGSLVAATVTLSYLAQLGINITLIRTLPGSDRKAADVSSSVAIVASFAAVLGLVYALFLPLFSPSLGHVIGRTWGVVAFSLLVAATAVNLLSDGVFLGLGRVSMNLRINGVLMGVSKCALLFLLAGFGAFGLFGAIGVASLVAALASVTIILKGLAGPLSLRPSDSLWEARHFAGAGYATSVLDLLPQLVLPVLIINASGASASALYFVSFQVVTLLNSACYAIGSAMYAEASRTPAAARALARRAGLMLSAGVTAGVAVLLVVSPLLLRIFGPEYADNGVVTLRVLALGVFGVALNYWSAIRLRLAHHLQAMVSVQLLTTVLMIAAGASVADRGPAWVAGAWGVGQLCGGLVGYVVSRTVAPLPESADEPASEEPVTGSV